MLTWFGLGISSETVTRCSGNGAEPYQTETCWDLLSELVQHDSVRCCVKCKRFHNHLNYFQSNQHATSLHVKYAIVIGRELWVLLADDSDRFFLKVKMNSRWANREVLCHSKSSNSAIIIFISSVSSACGNCLINHNFKRKIWYVNGLWYVRTYVVRWYSCY